MNKDFQEGYEIWAAYWSAKQQSKYIIQNFRLLIDTDLLKSYDELHQYARSHLDEKGAILQSAESILRHEICPWGDIVVQFGPTVDFNQDIGKAVFLVIHEQANEPTTFSLIEGPYLNYKGKCVWLSHVKSSSEGSLPRE